MISKEISSCIAEAGTIALIGNGGNLAIAQHAASDMSRHLGKLCYAPDAVHLTALGGDGGWHEAWVDQCGSRADFIIGITTRVDSPIAIAMQKHSTYAICIAPMKIPGVRTHVVNEETFHAFEVQALMSIYNMIESTGVSLPKI